MALETFNNGESLLSVRTKINESITLADTALQSDTLGVTVQPYDIATALTDTVQQWSAAQACSITPLVDQASIPIDFSASNNFTLTLGGNRSLQNPSNITPGQSGWIEVKQDATGSRTLTLGSYYKTAGGVGITLSTGANVIDTLEYRVRSSTEIDVTLVNAWS